MKAPSLLQLSTVQNIPDTTFNDLQLRRLLNSKTIGILSRPNGEKEILARQELFAIMRTEEGFNRIKESYNQLRDYERSVRSWRTTSVLVEKAYLFAEVLTQYKNTCQMLGALTDCGERFAAIAAYWTDALAQLPDLDEVLAKAKELFAVIGNFNISFSEKTFMTKDVVTKTVYSEIASVAETLGFTLPEMKSNRIRMTDTMSNAIAELYDTEYTTVVSLFEPYQDMDFDSLASYIPELEFFFYIVELCEKADELNIPTCYPTVAKDRKYLAKSAYDISLFIKNEKRIVPNDTFFTSEEPFFFITGANGGGKTTYLRSSSINLILFLGGCPVFAKSAEIYPFRSVLTHFPADERFTSSGRLQEEKSRVDTLLYGCDQDTLIVFNETYSGTDDQLGCQMTLETATTIKEKGTFGLFVTHFHEVRAGGWPILNTVIEENENHERTFRIVRDFGMVSSFATDILKKYKLDALSLKERGETV